MARVKCRTVFLTVKQTNGKSTAKKLPESPHSRLQNYMETDAFYCTQIIITFECVRVCLYICLDIIIVIAEIFFISLHTGPGEEKKRNWSERLFDIKEKVVSNAFWLIMSFLLNWKNQLKQIIIDAIGLFFFRSPSFNRSN